MTGSGKSTLILNIIRQDIERGQGFCLIDPHGDLAEAVRPMLEPDAIYWDPADPDCPFGYNPLTNVSEQYQPLVASGIIDAFRSQWADAWGVRMEHLLRYSVLALLTFPGSSLADIMPLCTKKSFRAKVLDFVTNEEVRKFWEDEFPQMNYKNAFDGVAPIANKLGVFLSHPVLRKVLCDPEQPLRFRQLMDDGVPVVINLSKGRLGSDISRVFGGLILSMITNAAMTRDNVPERHRKPYFVYVDEFAGFTTKSIAGMLSELRKYRVGMVLATQYLSGIKEAILDSILGNVGSILSLRLGAQDAPLVARVLGEIDPASLVNLPNYQMYLKLMVDGVVTKAFSARTCACSYSFRLFFAYRTRPITPTIRIPAKR